MTNGCLLFAYNNGLFDYIMQADFLAARIKKHLGIPTSIVTSDIEYANTFANFDKVIYKPNSSSNKRKFHSGAFYNKSASFKNDTRVYAYELSPYDKTLLLDTDYIISNDSFKNCFQVTDDFLIYKDATNINTQFSKTTEFNKISDTSIDFYWATCVYFTKTKRNKIFFDLLQHIQDNWYHYKSVYRLNYITYRNDFAFSIAIHIMNGFQQGSFAKQMPGKKYYITDRDFCHKIDNDNLTFLLEKKTHPGEYFLSKTKNMNVHVMNKFSLGELLNEFYNVSSK